MKTTSEFEVMLCTMYATQPSLELELNNRSYYSLHFACSMFIFQSYVKIYLDLTNEYI